MSRKRRSAKKKASRKRRSAKKKASRKRKNAKKKASRKRKNAKKKASRKRRSAKNKFRAGEKRGREGGGGSSSSRRRTIGRDTADERQEQRRRVQEQVRRQQLNPREQQWIALNDAERKRILFDGDAGAVQRAQEALNAAVAAGKVDRYFADHWNAHILLGPDGKFRRPNPNDEDFFEEHAGHWGTQSADGDWGPKQEEAFQFLNRYLRSGGRRMGRPRPRGSSRGPGRLPCRGSSRACRYQDHDKRVVTTNVRIAPYNGEHFRETRLVPTKCKLRTPENFREKNYGECDVLGQEKRVAGVRDYEQL